MEKTSNADVVELNFLVGHFMRFRSQHVSKQLALSSDGCLGLTFRGGSGCSGGDLWPLAAALFWLHLEMEAGGKGSYRGNFPILSRDPSF